MYPRDDGTQPAARRARTPVVGRAAPHGAALVGLLALACTDASSPGLAPTWDDVRPLRVTSGGLLRAGGRDLLIDLDADGVHLRHTRGDALLTLARWGRPDAPRPAWAVEPRHDRCLHLPALPDCLPGARAELPGLDAWWLARAGGVEQGWTFHEPPDGHGDLLVDLDLSGATARWDRGRVLLAAPGGGRWLLSGLAAWDADGTPLPARLDLRPDRLRLRVDDRGAAWPVVLDPLLSSSIPMVQPSYDAAGLRFGAALARAGDSDGDGLAEILVGDPLGPDGLGRVALFQDLDQPEAALLAPPPGFDCADAAFGAHVVRAGDIDGDGLDDVLIGQSGGACDPAWHLYLGAEAGLPATPAASYTDAWAVAQAADGVGDLDGDGYDDVAALDTTNVVLLRGGPSGLDPTPWTTIPLAITDPEGAIVRGVGDLDLDGLVDLLIGTPANLGGGGVQRIEARPDGSAPESYSPLYRPAGSSRFGSAIERAGDVDADGYDDVLVGDPAGGGGTGLAWLYFGANGGVRPVPGALLPARAGGMGAALGASDLDGDGATDVALASAALDGRLAIFAGATSGQPSTDPVGCDDCYVGNTSLLGVPDANGDGFDDLLAADLDLGALRLHGGCVDGDHDGWCGDVDCDDADPERYPDAVERVGDGIDSDCDGFELCYADHDDDHWLPAAPETTPSDDDDCTDPGEARASALRGDCDDDDASINPLADEVAADGVDADCDGVDDCWVDDDGDGFHLTRTQTGTTLDCTGPGEGGADSEPGDCDDDDDARHPGAEELPADGVDADCDGGDLCAADADADGYVGADLVASADMDCEDAGEALPGGDVDCDDADEATHPGAFDAPADGVDADCDGFEACYLDRDHDGWALAEPVASDHPACDGPGELITPEHIGDCDDAAPTIYPGADEAPDDGTDADCDGVELCWRDADADGFRGDALAPGVDLTCAAAGEAGSAIPDGDCDDDNPATWPGAPEIEGDGIDSACDGDELCAVDRDGDGYPTDDAGTIRSVDGDCADPGEAPPLGERGDCDDDEPARHPHATDVAGSGIDEDCDGVEVCLYDEDDDGFLIGRAIPIRGNDLDCDDPNEGWASDPKGDCNDTNSAVNPGALEIANNQLDDDCDGLEHCHLDGDGDAFYDEDATPRATPDLSCRGAGLAQAGALPGDCDDSDPLRNPFTTEGVDDGFDANCDGQEACWADADADGFAPRAGGTITSADDDCDDPGEAHASAPRTDCDDADPTAHPGAEEIAGDGRDADCDGHERCFEDEDGDGHASAEGETRESSDLDCLDPGEADGRAPQDDCDDEDDEIHPDAEERVADGVDSDCDGTELCLLDHDGDGFVGPDAPTVPSVDDDCDDPGEGRADAALDCDDDDADRNPEAFDAPADGIDGDCDGGEVCFDDHDGDGFIDTSGATRVSADLACDGPNEADAWTPTTDCDDRDAHTNPDAVEIVGNGRDDDCDGAEMCFDDADNDGFLDGGGALRPSDDLDCRDPYEGTASDPTTDCDDHDAARRPGDIDPPGDGVDGNCDGLEPCFADRDGDGHAARSGDPIPANDADCDDPGEADVSVPRDDCDDADPARRPGAEEVPGDEIDGDCNGGELCFLDADNDHVLDGNYEIRPSDDPDCRDPYEGHLATPVGDCDDHDRTVRPGAVDLPGDGVDGNCDGAESCYVDADNDGFRTDDLRAGNDDDCDDPGEASLTDPRGDCDDHDRAVHPGAVDTPADGRDSDCFGGDPCYADVDGDGWRTDGPATTGDDGDCDDVGEARADEPSGDCNDEVVTIHPTADDVPGNGVDDDCDGFELCRVDVDGDTWTTTALIASDDLDCDDPGESATQSLRPDCDDTRPDVNPGVEEIAADNVDQDCDGHEMCFEDRDGDGWRTSHALLSADTDCLDPEEALASEPEGDCADGQPEVNPGITEVIANGRDDDCDGQELCYIDIDNDGWRAADGATIASDDATCDGDIEASAATPGGDCDDTSPWTNPAGFEVPMDGIDQNCDGHDTVVESSGKSFLGVSCATSGGPRAPWFALLALALARRGRRG